MKYVIFLLCTLVLFSCYTTPRISTKNKSYYLNLEKEKEKYKDSARYEILIYDSTISYSLLYDDWFASYLTPDSLTTKEIEQVDKLISECVEKYNKTLKIVYHNEGLIDTNSNKPTLKYGINFDEYYRQYFPMKDLKNDKIVYAKCFHYSVYSPGDIENNEFYNGIKGGGDRVFWLIINLTTNTYQNFNINSSL